CKKHFASISLALSSLPAMLTAKRAKAMLHHVGENSCARSKANAVLPTSTLKSMTARSSGGIFASQWCDVVAFDNGFQPINFLVHFSEPRIELAELPAHEVGKIFNPGHDKLVRHLFGFGRCRLQSVFVDLEN